MTHDSHHLPKAICGPPAHPVSGHITTAQRPYQVRPIPLVLAGEKERKYLDLFGAGVYISHTDLLLRLESFPGTESERIYLHLFLPLL